MVKASDLFRKKDYEEKLYNKNYHIQFLKCTNHIEKTFNECHSEDTYYSVPCILPHSPHYIPTDCLLYLTTHLKKSEFLTRFVEDDPLSLYISWRKNDVAVIKEEIKIEEEKIKQQVKQVVKQEDDIQIRWHPSSAIDTMKLKSKMMSDNPKYNHLYQKSKRK